MSGRSSRICGVTTPRSDIIDQSLATALMTAITSKSPASVVDIAKEPAPGVRVVPFLTPEFCAKLIAAADARGGYKPDPDDPYPGQELSVLADAEFGPTISTMFQSVVKNLVFCCYDGFTVDYMQDVFIIRYSMDTQRSMGLHFDEQSDVSIAVALNDSFEGGGVHFPRYRWSTRDVPVGHAVLFPGKVTHTHEALPITSGVRYSMTWWTRQNDGHGPRSSEG
jgi:hypothetical protein